MWGPASWTAILSSFAGSFTGPSFALFCQLASAWVLCCGRHTVTGIILAIDPRVRRPHDAYHRFFRAGAWSLGTLWRTLTLALTSALCPEGIIPLDLDDTLFHKAGRKVDGAGVFRDAVRSTSRHVVYALGLNLVILTLRIRPPWGGEPLGLPINLRLYRKGGPSHLKLAAEMIREVAAWLPDRRFALACDGAYSSLAGARLPRTHVTSRMRRDAALFALPPPRRRGQRGRPRKKGRRLPTPEQMARRTKKGWRRATFDQRGKPVTRLLLSRPVLWYAVCPDRMVQLVIVRDPAGKQLDDFFFSTDLDASPEEVASSYAGRWSIEDTFRNGKQYLGAEEPQCWKAEGPARAAGLSLWLYSIVWLWYIQTQGTKQTWESRPWYPAKRTPSFQDALATLRRSLWRVRLFSGSNLRPLPRKTVAELIDVLARAA